MIHRQNWLDVRAYLTHQQKQQLAEPATLKRMRGHLNHLLTWADDQPLRAAKRLPSYVGYLQGARLDGGTAGLAPASIIKALTAARQFFVWAKVEYPSRYKAIDMAWVSTLRAPRTLRARAEVKVHNFWEVDDVRRLMTLPCESLRKQRTLAGVCLMFLGGLRADALASLPVEALDVESGTVSQLPAMGVRTKNRKAAITYLLNIPDLMAVVRQWHTLVRDLPPGSLWYSPVTSDGAALVPTTRAYDSRGNSVQRDLQQLCAAAGVPYQSPHKLRHGHVVYALRHARTMADVKAVSQNVMHSSVVITDAIYGQFTGAEVRNAIQHLGAPAVPAPAGDLAAQLEALLLTLRSK